MRTSRYKAHQKMQLESDNEMVRFVFECNPLTGLWSCHVIVDDVYNGAFKGVLKPCAEQISPILHDLLWELVTREFDRRN